MYLEHIPKSDNKTMTANSMIDAMVESGDKSITATFRYCAGISLMDIVRFKKDMYTITSLIKVGRTHLKIVADET